MAIKCVNTIEIRLFETVESSFEETARSCVGRLQDAAGCLEYALTRSTREAGLWRLTGYWESESQMFASLEGVAVMQLLNCLVEEGASLSFWNLVAQQGAAHGD